MPRKRVVTRSVRVTGVNVLGVYPDGVTQTHYFVVPGYYKSKEKLLKAVKAENKYEGFTALHVIDSKNMVKKYFMSEEKFVEYGELFKTENVEGV